MREFLVRQAMLFLKTSDVFHLKMSIIWYFCMIASVLGIFGFMYNSVFHSCNIAVYLAMKIVPPTTKYITIESINIVPYVDT